MYHFELENTRTGEKAENPDTYESDVARTLYNLAVLEQAQGHKNKSAMNYVEALSIYKRLKKQNPGKYAAKIRNIHDLLSEFSAYRRLFAYVKNLFYTISHT